MAFGLKGDVPFMKHLLFVDDQPLGVRIVLIKLRFLIFQHDMLVYDMLDNGVDIRYIQEMLGHKSIKTTEIYTHVSNKNLQNIKSPLDDIDFD